ncbi:MAG: Na+/H+ antiporter subunit C [Caldilineaceae bacterium SB0665_bin_25]|nr:Na+/H+ antiporter subunit C [Caldilineaceae bacterium SB0665_bin_25]
MSLLLATAVGSLFACGTYLILRRGQIKLILGLALLSHGVNLLLFGSGRLIEGRPPIFLNKADYAEAIKWNLPADPLPQALILTAIVISFGITAFVIVLVNRRHTVTQTDYVHGEFVPLLREGDPFDFSESTEIDQHDWLAYEVDEVYDSEETLSGFPPLPASEQDESTAMEEDQYKWP